VALNGLYRQRVGGYCHSGVHRWMMFAGCMTVALFLLACVPSAIAPAHGPSREEPTAIERRVLDMVNRHRSLMNLTPLTSHKLLVKEARQHSVAMARGRVPLGHHGFEERRHSIARSIPFRAAAENVGYVRGYANPAEYAVDQWLKSPGHARNIRGSYVLTGIGVAKDKAGGLYVTQIFWQPGTQPDSIRSAR